MALGAPRDHSYKNVSKRKNKAVLYDNAKYKINIHEPILAYRNDCLNKFMGQREK